MFRLHKEVSVDSHKGNYYKVILFKQLGHAVFYCEINDLISVINKGGTSCVKI